MLMLFAHAGEEHTVKTSSGILAEILHQPAWVGLLVVITALLLVYFVCSKIIKLNPGLSMLITVGTCIILGVLFMPHNPTVTGIVLSGGFVVTFLLVFSLLGKQS